VEVSVVPAYNVSKPYHPRAAGHVGYVFTVGGVTYYHAGDTDVIPEMEGLRCDVAFLPVGGTYTIYGVNRRLGCRNSLIWQDFSHQGESQL
jgi:L-ascorbate metabolism protein UlaG (beta-lactamase superfamily)